MFLNELKLGKVVKNRTYLFLHWMDSAPWVEDESVDVDIVDKMYIVGHSGKKIISPLVEYYLEDNELVDDAVKDISAMLWQIYGKNWERLWEVNVKEFNPIENYNKHLVSDNDESGKEILDRTHQGYDTTTNVGTSASNQTDSAVYGYNSSSPVPSGRENQSHDSTVTYTPGASDKEEKSFDERNTHYDETTTGNIGVTTSQQMLQSSIDLWQWKFWEQVYADMDEYLTCKVY